MPQARGVGVRIVQMLLGCALIVASVLLLRLHQLSVSACDGGLRPSQAIQTYQQRVRATQDLLRTDHLELSSRVP